MPLSTALKLKVTFFTKILSGILWTVSVSAGGHWSTTIRTFSKKLFGWPCHVFMYNLLLISILLRLSGIAYLAMIVEVRKVSDQQQRVDFGFSFENSNVPKLHQNVRRSESVPIEGKGMEGRRSPQRRACILS